MRVAVYYAPDPADPLWSTACSWLGRDAETGANVPQPDVPGIAELTASPRLYGFHCTLKPPMRLATAYDAFRADVARVATSLEPFDMPRLEVADLSGFLAVREVEPCPALRTVADACVAGLDAHRMPADEAELARRRGKGLPAAQEAMLARWGYPHVFEAWFFHMTLTRRLDERERRAVYPLAENYFDAVSGIPRRMTALSIFTQKEIGAPFLIAERVPFSNTSAFLDSKQAARLFSNENS